MAYQERFVSGDATGGGDGSLERPWTLEEAMTRDLTQSVRITLKAGTYPKPEGGGQDFWRGFKDDEKY